MQNIADSFFNTFPSRCYGVEGMLTLMLVVGSTCCFLSYLIYELLLFGLFLQIILIRLSCLMKEEGLHHLPRRKEDTWGIVCTRSTTFLIFE